MADIQATFILVVVGVVKIYKADSVIGLIVSEDWGVKIPVISKMTIKINFLMCKYYYKVNAIFFISKNSKKICYLFVL